MDAFTTIFVGSYIDDEARQGQIDRNKGIDTRLAANDGDFDETPEWDDSCTLDGNKDGLPDNYPPACDSNEQVLQLMLEHPISRYCQPMPTARAAVGEMISVTVKLQNIGNIHATDVSNPLR